MINLKGYEKLIHKVYDYKQDHVFKYWDELHENEKQILLNELGEIDFDHLSDLFSSSDIEPEKDYDPAPFIPLPSTETERKKFIEAENVGLEHIKRGKVAAFIVAGGQGSRLGFDGPKGKFPAGPVSGKSLFHFHGEKIKAASDRYGVSIPYLVMTSVSNHHETSEFFEQNCYFGLNRSDVMIFRQNMIPSLDMEGKLILSSPHSIFRNPDGHGGSLTALSTSGALDSLEKRGIRTISYFQVDNPLVKIIDPVFTGFHVLNKAELSSKALLKAYPEEKTGVFIRFKSGKTGIIEYSDMTEDKIFMKNDRGELLYSAGNPAIHLFEVSFIRRITGAGDASLPFHTARKKIEAYVDHEYRSIDGYKFEKFVFDALPLAEREIIVETKREEEFAPIKNAAGADSPETCSALMSSLFRKWIENKKIKIPEKVKIIEISPLYSFDGSNIPPDLVVPETEKVFIG